MIRSNALDKDFKVEIASVSSQIGSGSFPVEVLPSAGLAITSKTVKTLNCARSIGACMSYPSPSSGESATAR